jgi:hypothetical protein
MIKENCRVIGRLGEVSPLIALTSAVDVWWQRLAVAVAEIFESETDSVEQVLEAGSQLRTSIFVAVDPVELGLASIRLTVMTEVAAVSELDSAMALATVIEQGHLLFDGVTSS